MQRSPACYRPDLQVALPIRTTISKLAADTCPTGWASQLDGSACLKLSSIIIANYLINTWPRCQNFLNFMRQGIFLTFSYPNWVRLHSINPKRKPGESSARLSFPGSTAGNMPMPSAVRTGEIEVPRCRQQQIATSFCRGRFIADILRWGLATADTAPVFSCRPLQFRHLPVHFQTQNSTRLEYRTYFLSPIVI